MNSQPHLSHPLILLIDEVIRLNGRLKSVFAGVNAASGLPAMELTVLTAVVAAQAPPTVAQIGRSLGHPRQVIQRAARALLAAGLIAAAPNPHHKRAALLLATSSGKRLKRATDRRALKAANNFLHHIDGARCERLVVDIRKLRGQIELQVRELEA